MRKFISLSAIVVIACIMALTGCSTIGDWFSGGIDTHKGQLKCLMVTDGLLYKDADAVDALAWRISKDWRYDCLMAMTAFGPNSGKHRTHIFQGSDENGNVHSDLFRNIKIVEEHDVWVVPIIRCGYCYHHGKCHSTPIMDCGNAYSDNNLQKAVRHTKQLVEKHPKMPAIQVELEAKEGVEWSRKFIKECQKFYNGKFIVSIIGSRQEEARQMCHSMGSDVLDGPSSINCWPSLVNANRRFLHGDGADLCGYGGGLDKLINDLKNKGKHFAIWPRDGVMGFVPGHWLWEPNRIMAMARGISTRQAAPYSGPIADEDRP